MACAELRRIMGLLKMRIVTTSPTSNANPARARTSTLDSVRTVYLTPARELQPLLLLRELEEVPEERDGLRTWGKCILRERAPDGEREDGDERDERGDVHCVPLHARDGLDGREAALRPRTAT